MESDIMLDEKLILERIQKMTLQELREIMQEALEDSHIPYSDGPGAIVFDGLTHGREWVH